MSNPIIPFFIVFVSALFAPPGATAQQALPTNPFAARFVNAWKLERVQTNEGFQEQPPVVEFRMLVSPNETLSQGLYPEGMFESEWRFDVPAMRVYITDKQSAETYVLHVLQLTQRALVLETTDSGHRTLMYYTSLR